MTRRERIENRAAFAKAVTEKRIAQLEASIQHCREHRREAMIPGYQADILNLRRHFRRHVAWLERNA